MYINVSPQGKYFVSTLGHSEDITWVLEVKGEYYVKETKMRISVIKHIRIFCVSGYSEVITRVSETLWSYYVSVGRQIKNIMWMWAARVKTLCVRDQNGGNIWISVATARTDCQG